VKELGRSLVADSGPRLIKGIAVLGAAAVISKLLGTLQKIPLQNLAGDEAYGIYSAVYPFYVLILFLATAGYPVAVSKLVSEQIARGNGYEARRIYRTSAAILAITGIIGCTLLHFGAGVIAGWIGANQAEQAIRSVSYALLIVPYMAASRGYYQGLQDMVPTAVSQVTEQTVRVTVMITLILLLTDAGATSGSIAAGAMLGSAAGAAAGLVVMLLYDWRGRTVRRKRDERMESRTATAASSAVGQMALVRLISRHALPVALGSIAVPIISMIDSFTLPNMLAHHDGLSESEALYEYGVYARGLPLVQLVAMLFSSMSVALVPALSNARALGDDAVVKRRTLLAVRLTWMIGLAATCGLAVVSLPVNIMLFTDDSGTLTMTIVAWTAVFSSLNVVTAAVLQGLYLEKLPAVHLLVATGIKIILNLLLIPMFGIAGAAWSGVIAYAAAGLLNLRAVMSHTGLRINMRDDVLKPACSVIAMVTVIIVLYGVFGLLGSWFEVDTADRLWNTAQASVMIGVGAVTFALVAVRIGALREDELQLAPGVYRRVAPWLRRWHILRSDQSQSLHTQDKHED